MVIDRLRELGINVRDKLGEQRTTCPQCSHLRRKKLDRCLTVKIDDDGFAANCWHCGWTTGGRLREQSRHQREDFGGAERRIRYGFLS